MWATFVDGVFSGDCERQSVSGGSVLDRTIDRCTVGRDIDHRLQKTVNSSRSRTRQRQDERTSVQKSDLLWYTKRSRTTLAVWHGNDAQPDVEMNGR